MTTYATMRTRILDEIINESLTTAQVNAAIQSAIAHYQRVRFYFNETRAETFLTMSSQEFYDAADNTNIPNLSKIDKLVISVNGTRYPLTVQPWELLEQKSSTTTALGQPDEYSYYAQQIRLYPIPDGSYTVRISGLVRFAALSADGDTNDWMTDGEELIRARAKWDLAANVVYAPEIELAAGKMESIALRVLNAETVRRLSSRISGYM